jgi:hypothetical protein
MTFVGSGCSQTLKCQSTVNPKPHWECDDVSEAPREHASPGQGRTQKGPTPKFKKLTKVSGLFADDWATAAQAV